LRNSLAKKPLFSVIITTYNRASLLSSAIDSVLNQSYQNFELIIIDDGSTDNTEEAIKLKKGRITYYKLEENRGIAIARNKGLDLANGDYVTFLGSDDELLSEALEVAASKFAELSSQGVKVIWFDIVDSVTNQITGKGLAQDGSISYEDHICDRFRGDFWVVVDRSVLNELRFDERTWGSGKLLWLKLYDKAKIFHIARALYVVHREHGSRVSSDFRVTLKHKEKFLWSQKVFLAEYGQEVKSLCPRVYGNNLAALGFYHILNGEKSEGRRAVVESLKFCFSLRAVMLAFLSYVLGEQQIAFVYTRFKDTKYYLRRSRWFISSAMMKKRPSR